MSTWLVDKAASALARRTDRRGFLAKTAIVGSALTVAPLDLLLRPGTAYAAICGCAGSACQCGSACCDGYTQFCCTINHGVNACPPGTFAGGWWKADGSRFCAGPRYYIDCMGYCSTCTTGCDRGHFCSGGCDGRACECANGDCGNRKVGCTSFRYGQCHQEIACSGQIACRVVSCTPAWLLDDTCTTISATDNATANHTAPCDNPSVPAIVGMAPTADGLGYWLVAVDGGVYAYGSAKFHGSAGATPINRPMAGMASDPVTGGYWLVASDGGIFAYDAPFDGSTGSTKLNRPIVGMASTPDGSGYWLVAEDGGIFAFNAPFEGSTGSLRLNRPIIGMAGAAGGLGYWLVASDGGVFAFGSAPYLGSMGGSTLNQPIVGMASTPDGRGYWLVGQDGGIFSFGTAQFLGSMGGVPLRQPVVGMAATKDGTGYWLVAADGGVFAFGTAKFHGSRV